MHDGLGKTLPRRDRWRGRRRMAELWLSVGLVGCTIVTLGVSPKRISPPRFLLRFPTRQPGNAVIGGERRREIARNTGQEFQTLEKA